MWLTQSIYRTFVISVYTFMIVRNRYNNNKNKSRVVTWFKGPIILPFSSQNHNTVQWAWKRVGERTRKHDAVLCELDAHGMNALQTKWFKSAMKNARAHIYTINNEIAATAVASNHYRKHFCATRQMMLLTELLRVRIARNAKLYGWLWPILMVIRYTTIPNRSIHFSLSTSGMLMVCHMANGHR